ncbi:SDR family oxidoreductase [Legionella nagasakiensis]|uniref:SDR family oxidoreductase n=1 Tax=Legionella nagasakiensis TaxID=535290 RepID=UPI0013EF8083|nr:SDR family oxidoreductase [Legionella nagasakiensis]
MKIVFITGASSGIGCAAALDFARAGCHVIAGVRQISKGAYLEECARVENLNLTLASIDVTDDQSVHSAIESIISRYKKIDILINNAGAGFLGTMEQTTLEQAQQVMNVNFFSVWRVTQAVFPTMRKNRSGRIITITSIGGLVGQPFNDAYCAAKFAIEGMMESLAPVAQRLGIHISLVEPGPVNSEFVDKTLQKAPELPSELEHDYRACLESYKQASVQSFANFGQTPGEISKQLLVIASANRPDFRYQTSNLSRKVAAIKLADTQGNQVLKFAGSRLPEMAEVCS